MKTIRTLFISSLLIITNTHVFSQVGPYGKESTLDNTFATIPGIVRTDFANSDDFGRAVAIQPDGKIIVAGQCNDGSSGFSFGLARYTILGVLDNTFGIGGKVCIDIGGTDDDANSISIQADGKIVVAGYSYNGSDKDFALARYNTNGTLDTAFGSGGKVIVTFGNSTDVGKSVVVQTDGKIVVGGYSNNGLDYDFALVRCNSDGTIDSTFGSGGKIMMDIANDDDYGNSVAIQTDGKIIIAGYAKNGSSDFALVRFNINGNIDTAFGNGGKVITAVGIGSDYGYGVAIQPDGKIVIVGKGRLSGAVNDDFSMVRYDNNGVLDADFGTGGKVFTDFGNSEAAYSLAIQTDGKIVVAGETDDVFALSRYESNGTLDTLFGIGGKIISDFEASKGNSIAIQLDGKIVCAGSKPGWLYSDFALIRYSSEGTADNNSNFNGGGETTTDFNNNNDYGNAVAIQSDGKIVVAGYSYNGSDDDFALVRYNSDATLDAAFGNGGKIITDFGSSLDQAYSLAIKTDGKIVVGGWYIGASASADFSLVCYNTDGTLDNTFGNGGKVTTDFGGLDYGTSMVVQPDGKIVMAGYSDNGASIDFALVRYNSNGTLDNNFGTSGKITTDFGTNDRAYSIAMQPDGKLVVAGNSGMRFAIARYHTNGALDWKVATPTFASLMKTVAFSIAIQTDGKIIIAGTDDNTGGSQDFAMIRYDNNGNLDYSFGTSSYGVLTPFGNDDAYIRSIAIQSDGKIVAAGYSELNGANRFTIALYNSDGTLDKTFGDKGTLTTLPIGTGGDDKGLAMAIQEDGNIVVAGTCDNGSHFDFAIARYKIHRNVWPGDANNDFVVDNNDLLPIGLFYGQTGIARDSISNLWQGYPSTYWGALQVINNVDLKHADCNGDSLIDVNDTLAINLNFNLTHTIAPNNSQYKQLGDSLYIVTANTSYNAGDWVDAEVWLGTAASPVSNLYGIAFNIDYDASLIQANSESITYPSSWLGNPGTDAIKIFKADPLANIAYGAIVKTNHTNSTGYGKIADFKFQVKNTVATADTIHLSVSYYNAIDAAGTPQTFNSVPTALTIAAGTAGIEEQESVSGINIYPNPYTGSTTINYILTKKSDVNVEVYNTIGQKVETLVNTTQTSGEYKYTFSAKEKGFDAGVYFVKITVDGKVTMKRIVEMR